jgi:cytidylate kinase
MKRETLEKANELFKLYDINTFIKDNKIFLNLGDIEIQISKEEIKARASQFINLKQLNK